MNDDTYVIIPAYNEGEVLGEVIKRVLQKFQNVVCVNDGSKDKTDEVIRKSGAHAVSHPFNLGQGAALQTGVTYALRQPHIKYFITFDADGQHSITDAEKMLKHLKKNNLDIVLGSRFLGKFENVSGIKKIFLYVATKVSGVITGVKLTDTNVGLRVFNRAFADTLNITMNDMAHATQFIERIKQYNYKVEEFPVTITYSSYSKAKGQPMLNSINIVADLLIGKVMKW